MATLIKADGTTVKDIVLKDLKQKQELVGGGLIQKYHKGDKVFIFNENGLNRLFPYNRIASQELGHDLVGDVIIATRKEDSYL